MFAGIGSTDSFIFRTGSSTTGDKTVDNLRIATTFAGAAPAFGLPRQL